MSNSDQMLLELDELLPEKEEAQSKAAKKRTSKSDITPIEVSTSEIVSSEVEVAPVLSPQTLAEMEAGAKALQNHR